jgi:nicotinamide riboside transporter PnuC
MKYYRKELILPVILAVAVILKLNPFSFWMPDMAQMIVLVVIVLSTALFGLFLWRENSKDERDVVHRLLAARLAYYTGGAVLLVASVVQASTTGIDPWILITLLAMVLAKALGRIYGALNK